VFEQLRGRLIGLLAGSKNSIYDQRGSPYIPAYSHPPKRNAEEWLSTYGHSPRLGVVTKIAEDLSFAEGRLIRTDREGEDEVLPSNHPFWAFWNNPNPLPQFTKEAIWQLHQTLLELTGEGYMVIEKNEWGFPAELWPLPTHWVTGTPSAGNPYYNIRTPAGFMGQIHVDDMFVQMELNPLDPYGRGLGRAQAIADEVEIDEYASAFEKYFFYNNATPSAIIALEGADAAAIDRFEKKWNSRYKGVENAHQTAITSGRVSAIKLADNMKDIDMTNGRTFTRDTVLEHFHVPREIMGITENSNRSTAEAAQYIYAQNVLTPYLRKRGRAINIQLIPYWGDDLRFDFDEIIPRNQEFDKTVAFEGWANGTLMKNEARAKIDMEPTENGDVFQAPLLFAYVKSDQDLTQLGMSTDSGYYDSAAPEEDPYTGGKQFKARMSRLDQRAMQLMERAQREQERQAENATAQHFRRQRKDILEALHESATGTKDIGDASADFAQLRNQLIEVASPLKRAEMVAGFVGRLTDWSRDEERIREILSNVWSQTYEQGQGIMEQLYNLKNPHRPDVRNVFSRMGGQKISKNISDTTHSRICEIIDQGLQDGSGIDDIANQLGDCAELSQSRARLIAQQETYNSLSAANYDAMSEGGVQYHKWVTRGDPQVRDSHRKMNGEVRKVGEPFSNGLLYPRDPNGRADEVLRCRCWALPVRDRLAKGYRPGQIKKRIGGYSPKSRSRIGGEEYEYTGNQAFSDQGPQI